MKLLDPKTGQLTYVESTPTSGTRPRFFTLDLEGEQIFAANQDSDDITVFRIDPDTGQLVHTRTRIEVGSPSAISLIAAP